MPTTGSTIRTPAIARLRVASLARKLAYEPGARNLVARMEP